MPSQTRATDPSRRRCWRSGGGDRHVLGIICGGLCGGVRARDNGGLVVESCRRRLSRRFLSLLLFARRYTFAVGMTVRTPTNFWCFCWFVHAYVCRVRLHPMCVYVCLDECVLCAPGFVCVCEHLRVRLHHVVCMRMCDCACVCTCAPGFLFVHTQIYTMSCVWNTDNGAIVFGSAFGAHAFMSRVSPKKTVEGVLGGVALSVVTSALFWFLMEHGASATARAAAAAAAAHVRASQMPAVDVDPRGRRSAVNIPASFFAPNALRAGSGVCGARRGGRSRRVHVQARRGYVSCGGRVPARCCCAPHA